MSIIINYLGNKTFDIFFNKEYKNNCIVYNLHNDIPDYANISEVIKELPKNLKKIDFLDYDLFSLKLAFDNYQDDETYLKVYDAIYLKIYQLFHASAYRIQVK